MPSQFDTSSEGLARIIAGGESETVEFKSVCPSQDDVARILTAFANTDGGILIIGIHDDGTVAGLDDEHFGNADQILSRVAKSLGADIISVGSATLQGRSVVYATVDRAPDHRVPLTTSRGEVFRRTSHGVRKLPQTEAWRLMNSLGVPPAMLSEARAVKAFVAMSFRDEEEPALVDYFQAMKRAATRTGLPITLSRIDLMDGDYEISQRILGEIGRCDIIIADLTLGPRNVYLELGYGRGSGKRVIQVARKGTILEFDIRNWRTLFYRNATELEERLIPELAAAFREIRGTDSQLHSDD